MNCTHPVEQLRSAIGPKSGVLCGLCGQDVAAPLVFGALIQEIQRLRFDNEQLAKQMPGVNRCSGCRWVLPAEKTHPVAGRTMCLSCLDHWLDSDEDDCETAIPERARHSFAHWIVKMHVHRDNPHTLDKARQAFPWLTQAIKAASR
jgi:hypothetical protein